MRRLGKPAAQAALSELRQPGCDSLRLSLYGANGPIPTRPRVLRIFPKFSRCLVGDPDWQRWGPEHAWMPPGRGIHAKLLVLAAQIIRHRCRYDAELHGSRLMRDKMSPVTGAGGAWVWGIPPRARVLDYMRFRSPTFLGPCPVLGLGLIFFSLSFFFIHHVGVEKQHVHLRHVVSK